MGEEFVGTRYSLYDIIYSKDRNGVKAVRCIPHETYLLYIVGGKLARHLPTTYKNIIARSKKEAKDKYEYLLGWKATECVYIPPGDEAEAILTDALKFPI